MLVYNVFTILISSESFINKETNYFLVHSFYLSITNTPSVFLTLMRFQIMINIILNQNNSSVFFKHQQNTWRKEHVLSIFFPWENIQFFVNFKMAKIATIEMAFKCICTKHNMNKLKVGSAITVLHHFHI